jgi:hypothetical protein
MVSMFWPKASVVRAALRPREAARQNGTDFAVFPCAPRAAVGWQPTMRRTGLSRLSAPAFGALALSMECGFTSVKVTGRRVSGT